MDAEALHLDMDAEALHLLLGPVLPDNLISPLQNNLESVPVVYCDISEGNIGFVKCMKMKKMRELDISPFHVNAGFRHKVPVTPIENPHTGLSSHHIIRIINGQNGIYRVDLFIRDSDSYFLAFRRELILTEEEIQQGMVGGWGTWHKFRNAAVPSFLEARSMGLDLSYGISENVTAGGSIVLEDIYYTFGGFSDDSVAGWSVQRASYRVMAMFCETTRLRSMMLEVRRRIHRDTIPAILSDILWHRIKNWAHLSTFILKHHVGHLLDRDSKLPALYQLNFGLNKMNDLIGPIGEIMLIKHDRDHMGLTAAQLNDLETKAGAGHVFEPGFRQPK